jgi:hypothetical protein
MRINEADVGHILNLIANQPNRRNSPINGDISGDYDYWFDGGALQVITGSTRYDFPDGSSASVAVLPHLVVNIKFGNGSSVTINQTS